MEKAKIELQKEREFGDIFNAVFGFIGQEFKRLGKTILVFVLPVMILMSITTMMFQTSYFGVLKGINPYDLSAILQNITGISRLLGLYMLIALVGQGIFIDIFYSYIKLYLHNTNEFKLWDLYEEAKKNILPIIGALLLTGLIYSIGLGIGIIITIVLTLISRIFIIVGLLLILAIFIYLIVSFSMFIPILIIENKGFGYAFSRSLALTRKKFWWILLIIIVSIIMIMIMSSVLSLPTAIIAMTNTFHSIKSGRNPYEMFSTGYIIYSSITQTISQLFYIILYLAITFQYFSIVEMEERPSLEQKIIDELGENV